MDIAALLERLYEEHPEPSGSVEYVAHGRGRCKRVCWEWISLRLKEEVMQHILELPDPVEVDLSGH